MAKIIQLHLWMKDKKDQWTEPEVLRKKYVNNVLQMAPAIGKRIVLEPESDSITGMKIQIAKEILKWRRTGKLKSYYVVAVAQKNDGEVAFRTIIPTTIVV
jgi:hypothetical protein